MLRKVIKNGPATLSISLPAKWVKKYGIDKGSELFVRTLGSKIEISKIGISSERKKLILKTEGFDCHILAHSINAAYITGYDEIKVLFNDPYLHYNKEKYYNDNTSSRVSVLKFLNDLITSYIGFEVVSQTQKKIVIKELASTNDVELSTVSRRIFFLTKEMGEVFIEGLNNKSKDSYEVCDSYKNNVSKFSRYYWRILNKTGFPELNKNVAMYQIISHVEEICDKYTDLLNSIVNKKIKAGKQFKKTSKKIVELVNNFIDLLIVGDTKEMFEFYKKNSNFIKELEEKTIIRKNHLYVELKQLLNHLRKAFQDYLKFNL